MCVCVCVGVCVRVCVCVVHVLLAHLDQEWVSKSQGTLQVLAEGIIQEAEGERERRRERERETE